MVLAILRGQKVEVYVLGTKAKSLEFMEKLKSESKVELTSNPLFEEWVTIDQDLSNWLFGSMNPMIAADVVNLQTSQEVCKALEAQIYGATNKAQIRQLRGTLQNTKKRMTKMSDHNEASC